MFVCLFEGWYVTSQFIVCSYGRVLKINIFEVGKAKGAVVVFLDSKAASLAFSSGNVLDNVTLDVEYCESNGEPGFQKLKDKATFKTDISSSKYVRTRRTVDDYVCCIVGCQ